MKDLRRNIFLAVLLVLIGAATWSLQRAPARPNSVFLPEMYFSIPFDPQSSNPNFQDGATDRLPVKGTIPRGYLPLPYGSSESDAIRAGNELRNPFSPDSVADMERGTEVFRIYCRPCHGASGAGDGAVTRYGFPPPPAFTSAPIVAQKDGQLFHTITYGKRNMPSLASQVPMKDRWKAILHVRSLQAAANPTKRGN